MHGATANTSDEDAALDAALLDPETTARMRLYTLARDVLDELCQTSVTPSSVSLASDLYDRGRLSGRGDPSGLVATVVEGLCEQGLITYRVGAYGVPTSIRVTKRGYIVAGYRDHAQVGGHSSKSIPIRDEPTDFRTQHSTTWGGPIERMPLAEHLTIYPDHRTIHPDPSQVGCSFTGETKMTREVSSDALGDVMARARQLDRDGQTITTQRLASESGRSVDYVRDATHTLVAQGRLRKIGARGPGTYYELANGAAAATPARVAALASSTPADASSREAILAIIGQGWKMTSGQLLEVLISRDPGRWRGLGFHSLQHQLQSMRKAGLITFQEHRTGKTKKIINLALAERRADVQAESQETETTEAPLESGYPLLDALRARSVEIERARGIAQKYLDAAALLESIDKNEAERLSTIAFEMTSQVLSPVEFEYLRFANDATAFVLETSR